MESGADVNLFTEAAIPEQTATGAFMTLLTLQWWQLAMLFLPALLNLWGIWHAFRHEFATPFERVLWMMACIFLPLIGGLAYLLFGMRRTVPTKP